MLQTVEEWRPEGPCNKCEENEDHFVRRELKSQMMQTFQTGEDYTRGQKQSAYIRAMDLEFNNMFPLPTYRKT